LTRDELLAAMAAEAEAVAAHADRLDALGLDAACEARELAARWSRLVKELTPATGRPSRNDARASRLERHTDTHP
jgi:hypothetical protein